VDGSVGQRAPRALAEVLQRLVLVRLVLPLVAASTLAIAAVAWLAERDLADRHRERALYTARIVDRYLDQAARTLEAVASAAERRPADELTVMRAAWEGYGYFETLYRLDRDGRIAALAPPDPRYQGLDLSGLPFFREGGAAPGLGISRPFISVRTGNPTVHLVRHLTRGGDVVGELSLASLQDEITRGRSGGESVIFILDQSGKLIAHPDASRVRQQENQGALEIFRRGLGGDATAVYAYGGKTVLGSAARVERAGWVVVDQVPLAALLGPYLSALGLTLAASVAIWLALAWSLRRQLERHVAAPLARLSRGTGALASGDFDRGKELASVPADFAEVTLLAADFRHMSDALRRLNQELEGRVVERTAALEAANRELEAFAYSVSHDLRAPLRHIDGFLERLRERLGTALDAQSQHYVRNVSDAARRMGALIDDLLAFSRMARHEMSRHPVDLARLARRVIDELAPETAGRSVRWRVGDLPVVAGDRAMLQAVLANLLSNAVKFTRPREQAEIEIGCRPGQGGEVVVFVRDNGVGFDPAYAGKLFGVFQRLHRVDEFEGTGIGLANVRRIVDRHGGRTWAEGAVGQGATFCFSLARPAGAE
jgi:signal transduction histidine kinase